MGFATIYPSCGLRPSLFAARRPLPDRRRAESVGSATNPAVRNTDTGYRKSRYSLKGLKDLQFPSPAGFTLTTTGGTAQRIFPDLLPGFFSVTELLSPAWDLTGAICSDGSNPARIDLALSENVTCTYTNTKRTSLTVVKNALFGDATFNFNSQALGNFSLTTVNGTVQRTFDLLVPGTYDVSETVPRGGRQVPPHEPLSDALSLSGGKHVNSLNPTHTVPGRKVHPGCGPAAGRGRPAPLLWTDVGGGVTNGIVYALAHDGTTLYAAGSQADAFGTCTSKNVGAGGCNAIAKWDGTSWTPLGFGLNNQVQALLVDGTDLYAGGAFTEICGNAQCNAGNTPANHIAKWDGTTWTAVGTGTDLEVDALAKLGSNVIAGGRFTVAGTCNPCSHVAQWDGTTWSAVGFGVDAQVSALAVNGTTLYAGGTFAFICGNTSCGGGNTKANYIAQWDGTTWTPLNFGVGEATAVGNPFVGSLAVDASGDLYAGGVFLSVCGNAACDSGNTTVNNLAKWDGSAWSALGSGLTDAEVRAFAFNGSTVYVGGRFNFTGSQNIVQWNGSAFSGLGGGAGGNAGSIQAIVLDASKVYIGGNFFNAAGGACQACDAVAQMQSSGTLVIVKSALNGNGSFDFTSSQLGAFSLTTVNGTAQQTFSNLAPGTYDVSETVPNGWRLDSVTCSDGSNPSNINLAAGEDVTCTFQNTKRDSIVVVKRAAGGDATFDFASQSLGNFSLTTVNGLAQRSFDNLADGVYDLSEIVPAGWSLTAATCSDGSPVNRIALDPGETVTCTFDNARQDTIIVEKRAVGGDDRFSFTGSPAIGTFALNTSNGVASQSFGGLAAGTYAIAETVPAGWRQTAATCDNGNSPSNIQLAPGQTVKCTFDNEKQDTITVIKRAVGGDATFPFVSQTLGNFNLKTVKGEAQRSFGNLAPGIYDLSETVPAGWNLSAATCSDGSSPASIRLSAGVAVTCTFTNLKQNSIVIEQRTQGGDGAFADEAEEADLTGVARVRAAAEFHAPTIELVRLAADLHDADEVAVFFTKEGHDAVVGLGLDVGHFAPRNGIVGDDALVHEALDVGELLRGERGAVEVEGKLVRRDAGAFLCGVLADDLVQRPVQDVRDGVVALDGMTTRRIDDGPGGLHGGLRRRA